MPLSCGIVGLPNVGKSTIFNLLTNLCAKTSPYPFCTIKPNRGLASIKDERLFHLAKVVGAKKTIFANIEFVDCAGLVKDAHKGEGLGSEFLSHVRGCNLLVHVVRLFKDERIPHSGTDPVSDFQTVNTELALKDLEVVERGAKRDKRLKRVLEELNSRGWLYGVKDVQNVAREYGLLSAKPQIVVANIDGEEEEQLISLQKEADTINAKVIPVSAKIEEELVGADNELKEAFEAGKRLEALLRVCKEMLGLITFFTIEHSICQAWAVQEGIFAIDAAARVHSQMKEGFIAVQVFHFDELMEAGSLEELKRRQMIHSHGRDYRVKDADVLKFLFRG